MQLEQKPWFICEVNTTLAMLEGLWNEKQDIPIIKAWHHTALFQSTQNMAGANCYKNFRAVYVLIMLNIIDTGNAKGSIYDS